MAGDYENPFDRPFASEVQDHQQAQTATVAASDNGNPFNEPLMSEKAEAQAAAAKQATPSGQPGYVPNARIRNLPNPAEGMTPGEALVSGAATGAGLAALPASSAVGDVAAPIIAAVGSHLSTIKNIMSLAEKAGIGAIGYKEARELYKEFAGGKN
ncbi:MAG: hypothetical protein WBQ68_06200 [Terriglobales bacterium]